MARCSTKGCKQGATQRLTITDQQGNSKSRPVCGECSIKGELSSTEEGVTVKLTDADKKHH